MNIFWGVGAKRLLCSGIACGKTPCCTLLTVPHADVDSNLKSPTCNFRVLFTIVKLPRGKVGTSAAPPFCSAFLTWSVENLLPLGSLTVVFQRFLLQMNKTVLHISSSSSLKRLAGGPCSSECSVATEPSLAMLLVDIACWREGAALVVGGGGGAESWLARCRETGAGSLLLSSIYTLFLMHTIFNETLTVTMTSKSLMCMHHLRFTFYCNTHCYMSRLGV